MHNNQAVLLIEVKEDAPLPHSATIGWPHIFQLSHFPAKWTGLYGFERGNEPSVVRVMDFSELFFGGFCENQIPGHGDTHLG